MPRPFWLFVLTSVLLTCTASVLAQSISSQERDRGIIMLRAARDDIRKYYYDPAFRGIDLDARSKLAEELVLPTAEELRAQKDSVLARAAAVAGGTLDSAEAGNLFPFRWKP